MDNLLGQAMPESFRGVRKLVDMSIIGCQEEDEKCPGAYFEKKITHMENLNLILIGLREINLERSRIS
jgi:hypothetical protein